MAVAYPARKVFVTGGATGTITGVVADSILIAEVSAFRFGAGDIDLVSGVTSHAGARVWTLVTGSRARRANPGSNHTIETSIWYYAGAPAGNAAIVVAPANSDGNTQLTWGAQEYTGARTSGAEHNGRTGTAASESSSVSVATTGVLPQADVIVVGIHANKYGFTFVLPGGFTGVDEVSDGGGAAYPSAQIGYALPAATTAIAASWGQVNQVDQGAAASVAVFLGGVTQKRIEITGIETTVNGTAGWTVYHWITDGATITAARVQNVTAEATGGAIYVVDASVPNVADDTSINCVAYRPGASPIAGLVGVVTGKVKDYT
jgi:hypothetical protein